jgi:hypothetical protein
LSRSKKAAERPAASASFTLRSLETSLSQQPRRLRLSVLKLGVFALVLDGVKGRFDLRNDPVGVLDVEVVPSFEARLPTVG